MKTLIQLPELPTGSLLNPEKGFLSVVIPLERTNLITCPSFEGGLTGTQGPTAINGATSFGVLGGVSNEFGFPRRPVSYHGRNGLAIGSGSPPGIVGVYWDLVTPAGVVAFSLKILGAPGVRFQLDVIQGSGVVATNQFYGEGRWQWVWVLYKSTGATAQHRVVRYDTTSTSTASWHVDGIQVESCADGILAPTTYIDGDQQGLLTNQFPPPYRWNGTPHASTSTRLVTTRAGGYLMNLDRYFYKALAYTGLGLTAVANIASVGAGTDGATYQTTVAQSRQFAINGFFDAYSPQELDYRRSQLYQAIGPDSATPRQPVVLIYQAYDGYDAVGNFGQIIASYQSGLEQNSNATPHETTPITFTAWLPTIRGGDNGATLATQSSVSNANAIIRRTADGTWSALGTGASGGRLSSIAVGLDGKVYAAGLFTSMGGVANTSRIAYWDGSAWNAMGTGANGDVYALAVAPNGDIIASGNFTLMSGVANTVRIARWNGSSWSALSTGANAAVTCLAFGPDGILYAGGNFTTIGGVALNRIAKWNGSAWSAVAAAGGADNTVNRLIVAPNGLLYAGGGFANIGGVAAAYIAVWNSTTWAPLSTGMDAQVQTLALDRAGFLYAGGDFGTAGSSTANHLARWNGSGWSALANGVNNNVYSLADAGDGTLVIGGIFSTANGIAVPDGLAIWNGSALVTLDVDLPGTATAYGLLAASNGTLYIGYDTTGTATAGAVTTTTNSGTARTYPTFTITGPSSGTGRVFRITNTTTGRLLYLNLTINAGETVKIVTSNNGTRVTSDFRGDISSVVLPGSSPDFVLAKGSNTIAFFSTSSTVAAIAVWPTAYQSASDLID